MATEWERKIREAIAECDSYIAKESSRDDDLRPDEIKKLLGWYFTHREKLIEMLKGQTDALS